MVASKMRLLTGLLGACGLAQWSYARPTEQAPLREEDVNIIPLGRGAGQSSKQRPLHGRFLHITGMHTGSRDAFGNAVSDATKISIPIGFTKYTPRRVKTTPATMDKAPPASTAPRSAIATARSR